MGWIEIERFKLASGVSREAFAQLDAEVQVWAYLHRPRLVRRTTALGAGGEVLVVTLFTSGATPVPAEDPRGGPLEALRVAIETGSYDRAVYRDLDGAATAAPG